MYSKEGFEKATQYIGYYKPDSGKNEMVTSIKGYTFNLEKGRIKREKLTKKGIFDEKRSKYRSVKKMTMPAIKEGCIIELKYKLVSDVHAKSVDPLTPLTPQEILITSTFIDGSFAWIGNVFSTHGDNFMFYFVLRSISTN